MDNMKKILIVDDNTAVLEALSLLLEIHGYHPVVCETPTEALHIVRYQRIALVLQDMNFSADTTSGEEGRALFYQLREINPHLPVVLITAWTELSTAVELVKAGAADYIGKPWDDQKLLTTIENLVALGEAASENATFKRQAQERSQAHAGADLAGLVFASAAMQRVVDMALQVAHADVPVLITGANGSGKEGIAEIVHRNSVLKAQPFIKVNAGALPSDLIEAELFGAEAGAFTGAKTTRIGRFEAADGGTLFLDEIGNLSLDGQMKLLRVLQSGEFERVGSTQTRKVSVRVISATNADLRSDIQQGRFREDLYYRLNVIELAVPPLCQRQDDIPALIAHFLPGRELSPHAEQTLRHHSWPGNVRELENACKRIAVLKPQGELQADDFALQSAEQAQMQKHEPSKQDIEHSMRLHQGVVAKVARDFGLSRQALYRRMQKFGIEY